MGNGGSDAPSGDERRGRRPRVIRMLSAKAFLEISEEEVDRALRYDRPLSVLMIQLEGISRIRKAEGSQIGEEAIASAAERIARGLRRIDRIGRLGLGELGILLPETRLGNAELAAIRLRDSFASKPVEIRAGPRPISLNIGISTVNPRMRNAKTFLMLACAELRNARRIGDGEISTIPPELVRISVARNGSIH